MLCWMSCVETFGGSTFPRCTSIGLRAVTRLRLWRRRRPGGVPSAVPPSASSLGPRFSIRKRARTTRAFAVVDKIWKQLILNRQKECKEGKKDKSSSPAAHWIYNSGACRPADLTCTHFCAFVRLCACLCSYSPFIWFDCSRICVVTPTHTTHTHALTQIRNVHNAYFFSHISSRSSSPEPTAVHGCVIFTCRRAHFL